MENEIEFNKTTGTETVDGIVTFNRPVYEKIWTGNVDQLISYNRKTNELTVKDVLSGKERTHLTSIDARRVSFNPHDFKEIDDKCIYYLMECGVKRFERLPERFEESLMPTKKAYDDLLIELKRLENGELKYETTENGPRTILSDHDINRISGLANSCLITSGGGCNWGNISKLIDAGYDVFAGEKDSFGWLSGCIRTSKGIIIYG